MSETYYQHPDANYPHVIDAVLQSLKYHMCAALYPDEDFATVSNNRFLMANFTDGTEFAIRESISHFASINDGSWHQKVGGGFPFTAYQLSDDTIMEDITSHLERCGLYYSDYFGSNISTIPIEFMVDMATFYTQPSDYYHAKALLEKLNTSLQRMDVPITANGIADSFTSDVKLEITRGGLAFNDEQRRQFGDIYEIFHTAKINMRYIIIPGATIYPVDIVEFNLHNLPSESEGGYLSSNVQHDSTILPSAPEVTSTSPSSGATNIEYEYASIPISITFDSAMDEDSVENLLTFYPWISADFSWNSGSTILTIQPVEDLATETTYTITLDEKAEDFYGHVIDEDYIFTFTTKVE